MDITADPIALAAPLLARVGAPPAREAGRLAGGKNNRVFALSLADDSERILKLYFRDARDPRDRLGAEWRFLSYATARGIEVVPKPLAASNSAGAALYTRLAGEKLEPHNVAAEHVVAARDFVVALNARPCPPSGLAPASEACFSLAEHLGAIERRVSMLDALDPLAPHREEAADLVATLLRSAWSGAAERVRTAARVADQALNAPLPEDERIVSPSDFGFHNALVENGHVCFLDFEYAGIDDPAKLVGDLFSVPEIPTPLDAFDLFVEGIADRLCLGPAFAARARALTDAYRVKWACIILNDFLPQHAARRGFALCEDRAARCRVQLDKARAILGLVPEA